MGAATAKRFHEEGATVIVTGSNPTTVEAARKAMPYVEAIVSDAGDPQAAMALVDRIRETYGRIDVLFVNAGMARVALATATTETIFDMLFATDVRGPYFLLKHAIPVLSDAASVILTSSAAAVQGMAGLSAYSASKAARRSLGMSLAAELAPRRIRVNTITPGPINTPIAGKMELTPEQMAGFGEMIARVPLAGRAKRTKSPPRRCISLPIPRALPPGRNFVSMAGSLWFDFYRTHTRSEGH